MWNKNVKTGFKNLNVVKLICEAYDNIITNQEIQNLIENEK
jgi:hypothetical protein